MEEPVAMAVQSVSEGVAAVNAPLLRADGGSDGAMGVAGGGSRPIERESE
jgi:hypothetical protein